MTCHVRDYLNALHFVRCSFSLYAYQKFDVVHRPTTIFSRVVHRFRFRTSNMRVGCLFRRMTIQHKSQKIALHRPSTDSKCCLTSEGKISYALTSSGSASSRSSAFLRAATHGYSCLCLRLLSLQISFYSS